MHGWYTAEGRTLEDRNEMLAQVGKWFGQDANKKMVGIAGREVVVRGEEDLAEVFGDGEGKSGKVFLRWE